jgi:hypothetical protein
MSDLSSFSASNPKYAAHTIIQTGTRAYELLVRHQPAVEPRLPPLTVLELAGDLEGMGATLPGPKVARIEASVAVASQLDLLAKGAKLIGSIRKLVRRAGVSRDVKKAYGVGVRVNPEVAKDVLAVLGLIRDRAAENPAEPATLGIVQRDLDAVAQAIADIDAAVAAKMKKRVAAPLSTKHRNQVFNRILSAARRIAAAGQAEFREVPEIAKQFAAAAPPPIPKKKRARKAAKASPAKEPVTAAKPA